MISIIIRSIIAQFFIAMTIISCTIVGYIYTFIGTTHSTIEVLTKIVTIFRSLIFFSAKVKVEYRGLENIPQTPCVFASKHQSLIETTFFFNQFKIHNVYAYKKEISDVFLWGKISDKFGGIRIDRKLGAKMIESIAEQAKHYLDNGFSVTIFPEGTRIKAGENGKFKKGIAKIYSKIDYPVVPVAINAGVILPKKSFFMYPATLIVEFLPAMPANLSEEEFLKSLESKVNAKSQELYLEAKRK